MKEVIVAMTKEGVNGLPVLNEMDIRELFFNLYWGSAVWNETYYHGVQTLKCPLDLWIYQEIIHECRPDTIIETGTFKGGSALYLAHALDGIGKGKVITVDNKSQGALPEHPRIEYVYGDSTSASVEMDVRSRASGAGMALLDSDHRSDHVFKELEIYGKMVEPGQYMIVEDTCLWGRDGGPKDAIKRFLPSHPEFSADLSRHKFHMTFNPFGYLRKK